jgi:hypothetical protein
VIALIVAGIGFVILALAVFGRRGGARFGVTVTGD